MKRRKQETKRTMAGIFLRMIKESFLVAPGKSVLYALCDVLHAWSIVLTVVLTQAFFDDVEKVANGGMLSEAVVSLICFLLGNLGMEICNGISNFHTEYLSPRVIERMYEKLHRKTERLEAIFYEDPEFLNQIDKAKQGIETGYLASLFALSIITFYLPYYLFMAWYLRGLSPFLILILLCVFFPVILGKIVRFHIFVQVEEKVAPMRRAMEYYEDVICNRDYYKETRILGGYSYFINLFREKRDKVNSELLNAEIKHARMEFLLRLITISGYIAILFLLMHELLVNKITAGAFAAVFAGVGTMYNLAEEVFGGVLQYVSRNASVIYNYQKFIDMPEQKIQTGSESIQLEQGIFLQNVHFRYPNAEQEAIQGITFFIPSGKTVAIVGENGSGKSTLMKLVMGMYQPTAGKITVGGVENLKENQNMIKRECSAVFQKFQRYRMTLERNVAVSDMLKDRNQEPTIQTVCKEADVLNNENSLLKEDMMLSKEFGGIDLSGGEWQKVALARGMYRRHNIIVLDEPTAAIDPIEETKVYRQFARLSKEKTAFVVTHRIGAAQIADLILVLKQGKVVESGTHQELLKCGGVYSMMYKEQAKWYKSL